MNAPNYNFQTTEPDKNLALNEYYFVCDYSAHFLKTIKENVDKLLGDVSNVKENNNG